MSLRAEFMLQAQAQKIETALKCLVKEKEEELTFLCQEFTLLKLNEAIIANFKKNMSSNLLVLPERIFEISEVIKQRYTQNTEVVGQKDIPEKDNTESCFKSEDSTTRNVWGVVEYNELSLPDADTMVRQWSDGVEKGKQKLWDILCNWIIEGFNIVNDVFNQSVDDVINLGERALQEQLKIIEENFAGEMQRWSNLEVQKASITTVLQQLKKESCLSNNIDKNQYGSVRAEP